MQAVILAGGLGTRLRPLTKTVPKPMVPVGGTPYLEYQLRLLREQAITDIVLLTGYLGEQIEEHFGDGSRFGLSIRYSREDSPLGTGGALRIAKPLLADSFLVIYGDSYLPIQYGDVLTTLAASTASGVVTVYDNDQDDTGVTNNIALDETHTITRYEKDKPDDPELRYVEARRARAAARGDRTDSGRGGLVGETDFSHADRGWPTDRLSDPTEILRHRNS